ncbi:MAG: plastocyanin/azurin family copper-binding protein [Anaerolineae bacterium]|nr:plastocyanin/azurin family copper-binding protein [Thermoflexales bacterium]MDW8408618.1 plastocyanin/azurin family copper-binding protein [Anaerolineae bacterium]
MNSPISRRRLLRLSVSHAVSTGFAFGLSACGGSDNPTPSPVASTGKTFEFEISADDNIQFSQVLLEVEAGSRVSVTLVNNSKDKQFNWVLTRFGQMLRVVTEGQISGVETGYLKPGDSAIIASTRLVKAGERDTVTFDAPPPGEYQFFTTFPGYYTRMNGKLVVR